MTDRLCIGYGPYEGRCDNVVERGKSLKSNDLWCERCERLRMETINAKLHRMLDTFDDKRWASQGVSAASLRKQTIARLAKIKKHD